jgi:hypothetical protein
VDSRALSVAIGMVFVFAVTAAVSSMITELVGRYLGLRSKFLLIGLREILDGPQAPAASLSEAVKSFEGFTDRRERVHKWDDWAQGAAAKAEEIVDDAGWSAWTAASAVDAHRLGDSLSEEQAKGWAETWAGKGKELRQPTKKDWTAWAGAAANEGQKMSGVPEVSATQVLLGTSILRTQGMRGLVTDRNLTIEQSSTKDTKPGHDVAKLKAKELRGLPSYISARSFSAAVFDMIVPSTDNETTVDEIRRSVDSLEGMDPLKEQLQSLLKTTDDKVETFRTAVEAWYDDHMNRVSGWYKRHVAWWTLGIGAILVVAFNINSITIARTLYTDEDVRAAVVAVATNGSSKCRGIGATDSTIEACLSEIRDQTTSAQGGGLPVGWAVVAPCKETTVTCRWWEKYNIVPRGGSFVQPLWVILGLLLTVAALVPGSRFWFDGLSKLGSLRTTGPKPPTSSA